MVYSASVSNGTVTITGVDAGEAVITVTDADSNSLAIAVKVTEG